LKASEVSRLAPVTVVLKQIGEEELAQAASVASAALPSET
jgi:hypothetical protein